MKLLAALNHPHIPRVYDHFTDAEHWYLVLQFVQGETLEQYLHNPAAADPHTTRKLLQDEVVEFALRLCNALQYLRTYTPPIIFRDLKPSNIMRTPEGKLYLIDFGIARHYKKGKAKDTITRRSGQGGNEKRHAVLF
jgi:Serine/threonine protein kinase